MTNLFILSAIQLSVKIWRMTAAIIQRMSAPKPSGARIAQLDGLRGLAVLAVLVHHLFHMPLLWMGVDLFFVLSGFLITGILLNHRDAPFSSYIGSFYARRLRRIWPPYVLLMIVVSIVFGFDWLHHAFYYLFAMNLLLPLGLPQPLGTQALWSLAVEEQFYLAWPVAVYLLTRRRLAFIAIALILIAPILRWACTPMFTTHFVIYLSTPFRMDLLASGALLAILWRTHPERMHCVAILGIPIIAVSLGLLLILSFFLHVRTIDNTVWGNVWIYELTLLISVGAMLYALRGKYVRWLKWTPLAYIGRISYSMYLIHLTAIYLLRRWTAPVALQDAVILIATTAYAAASWQWLEKPILSSGTSKGY